jgi:GAF domain-containing protein
MDPTPGETAVSVDPYADLTRDFTETARILFSAGGVENTLAQVAAVAVATIDGCDFAGLFRAAGSALPPAMGGDPVMQEIDDLQRACSEGPSLEAMARQSMVYADDLELDTRWPQFGLAAAGRGVRSALALPLTAGDLVSAVTLYARHRAAFGVVDRAKGVILASLATVALSAAHSFEDEERRIDNLHSALSSREVIGQAQGILMERERISADQAFAVLRRASQRLNIKLKEVAQNLVDTGEQPDTGPGAGPASR